ncbi:hypothetical protein [Acidovorax sp. GW101-3H11]|uniref:hypothetical protein n=1 Tax=Acidovorax sp. GW101-3H11 TaxID=1813946 RepID=UPI0012FFC6DC|nr:hypothetical protein [Acidovorax sp. GW101-3H11]
MQGRLFFGDFLLAKQKKATAPPGAHPGLRPEPKHACQTSTPRLRQAQPERADVAPSFDKLNPNGWVVCLGFDRLSPNEQQAPQHRNALSCDGKKRSQINS